MTSRMSAAELLLDADEPTPCIPISGIRVRDLVSAEDYALGVLQDAAIALKARNTIHSTVLLDKVECAISAILSWEICPATDDVRVKVLEESRRLARSALTVLGGGR